MVIIRGRRVIAWTREAERATGILNDEALGRPCHEVLALGDPSGTPLCAPDCPLASSPLSAEGGQRVRVSQRGRAGTLGMWTATGSCDGDEQLIVHTFVAPAASSLLTRRQTQILDMISRGMATADIAARLHLANATVRNHVAHILDRLGARSRAHAVARAQELGLLGGNVWDGLPAA
jgi:DNA-binding CsgD family transcriptional regulator